MAKFVKKAAATAQAAAETAAKTVSETVEAVGDAVTAIADGGEGAPQKKSTLLLVGLLALGAGAYLLTRKKPPENRPAPAAPRPPSDIW